MYNMLDIMSLQLDLEVYVHNYIVTVSSCIIEHLTIIVAMHLLAILNLI